MQFLMIIKIFFDVTYLNLRIRLHNLNKNWGGGGGGGGGGEESISQESRGDTSYYLWSDMHTLKQHTNMQ